MGVWNERGSYKLDLEDLTYISCELSGQFCMLILKKENEGQFPERIEKTEIILFARTH